MHFGTDSAKAVTTVEGTKTSVSSFFIPNIKPERNAGALTQFRPDLT
jgi:hypothetical protein